jgi:hypothetical protein
MAAITAVVIAIFRSGWRSLHGAKSFTRNNLVALIALLMAAEPGNRPSSTAVIYLMVVLLWVVPLSQELTRRIPSIRSRLWPLSLWKKAIIYAINLLLNPLVVIAILFGLLSRDRQVGLGLAAVGAAMPLALLVGKTLTGRNSRWSPLGLVPRHAGPLGGLVQSHIRELLQLLDVSLALVAAIGGVIYTRFSAKPNPEASVVLGCFVVLLMSTCAQGHVTFDAQTSQTRMRLLPVSGVAVLFAKDAAWMMVTIPRVVGFFSLPCAAAALAALVTGHRTSVNEAIEQKRWNFATGRLVPQGIAQMIGLVGAGSAVQNWGWWAFAAVVALYGGSLWSGRQWDRR